MRTPEEIISDAVNKYNPSTAIVLCSFGYDSLYLVNYVKEKIELNIPVHTYAIDTQLSADGWRDHCDFVSRRMGWKLNVLENRRGFQQYLEMIVKTGQPHTRTGHKYAYWRLKDRAIDAIKKKYKTHSRDHILFLSGIRKAESVERGKVADEYHKRHSAVFANPLLYWSNEDILRYRIENELPENPFYETVGGSGDCQCNWGNFISLRKLKKHSPKLAMGNVALIDELSRKHHGYGWDMKPVNQKEMFGDFEDTGEMCSPFLCAGCSRSKEPKIGLHEAQEAIYLQGSLF